VIFAAEAIVRAEHERDEREVAEARDRLKARMARIRKEIGK
jgi:hypothetical protein